MSNLSTKPYRGSRDFYPEEAYIRKKVFNKLRGVLELFSFKEIEAPLIEPIELYLAKTSEEIVNGQIYSFLDRGNRQVAIRPEMTPSVSRMVAGKLRILQKPIRWYFFPNLWRYERPSRGRLREHWQLNTDIFASPSEYDADLEILQLALSLMASLGAQQKQFKVLINHRAISELFFKKVLQIESSEKMQSISRILDKKNKISLTDFDSLLHAENLNTKQMMDIHEYLNLSLKDLSVKFPVINEEESCSHLIRLIEDLKMYELGDCVFYSAEVIRGFNYYTGMVFEVFDTSPDNNRSLFGGGRYNNLVASFFSPEFCSSSSTKHPSSVETGAQVKNSIDKNFCNAVGFGMGDVTLMNFLESHALMPSFDQTTSVYVASFPDYNHEKNKLAFMLRKANISVEVNLGHQKLNKQFNEANSKNIPFVVLQGENEIKQDLVTIKDMKHSKEYQIKTADVITFLKEKINERVTSP